MESSLRRTASRGGLAAAALLGLAAFAPSARAEEVVLASGSRYDASEVVLLENAVRFTYHPGGGSATVTFPFDRIDPHSLFSLYVARTPADDPAGQLRLAKIALQRRLLADAAYRFRKAAQLDPLLAPERDAGLAAVTRAEAERVLAEAEEDLRRGRSDKAIAKAGDVLSKVPPESDLAAKAKGLSDLAAKVLERDQARLAAEAQAKGAAAAAAAESAFAVSIARADKTMGLAMDKRGKAADPNLSASGAIRTLESAESLFRETRRLLQSSRAVAGPHAADVDARDSAALGLLVATHLDLAELYRQQRRFSRAQDRVRAALVLDPENTRAREIEDRIQEDLRTPVLPPDFYSPPTVLYESTWLDPYPYSPVLRSPRVVWPYGSYGSGGWWGGRHGGGWDWGFHFHW
jgi:tetratricopeptide (TPR) repeat protein